ncbi:MAG: 2-hydroxyacyl-CoA dehydratase [Thermoplasmata archaeon]|nr:MAG: 2-hydroxyacyl-CoA dehydratase [Thermoplasmata archaeon]
MASEQDLVTVGITSTIPIEVPLAAEGVKVVDMNNQFITGVNPQELVARAERAGLSFNLCGWVKGLFAMGMTGEYDKIIVVDGGDCADLVALADFWEEEGVEVIYFNYPKSRQPKPMKDAIESFMEYFEVTNDKVNQTRLNLAGIRSKLYDLDTLTWKDGKVTGLENHLYLVQSSDFGSDLILYERALDNFIEEASARPRGFSFGEGDRPRLGFVGVPPIITNFYQSVDLLGGAIVYNETQHQFSMPFRADDIVEQYLSYTYPYGGKARMEFILKEIERRKLQGIILYTENFCYKSIINTYIRSHLKVPSIEIEGKSPENMDARTKLRLEAFIEMLRD